jgi:riboflavin synthase
MYTGIVQAMLPITSVDKQEGLTTFSITMPEQHLVDLNIGASVAVNGTCFTVTRIDGRQVFFDAIAETMRLTNLKDITAGSQVNIERSAAANAEVGGHILSGHIIDTATVTEIINSDNNQQIHFRGHPDWMKFVFNKGFLALNGCSLTVAEIDRDLPGFAVNLIPETLRVTNFALLSVGDEVNVEIDQQTQVIVETVERVLQDRQLT